LLLLTLALVLSTDKVLGFFVTAALYGNLAIVTPDFFFEVLDDASINPAVPSALPQSPVTPKE
jgi:hypothetical protein